MINRKREILSFSENALYDLAMALRRILEPSFSLRIPDNPEWLAVKQGGGSSALIGSEASGWRLDHSKHCVGPGDVGELLHWNVRALGLFDGQRLQVEMQQIYAGGITESPTVRLSLDAPEPLASQILLLFQQAGA